MPVKAFAESVAQRKPQPATARNVPRLYDTSDGEVVRREARRMFLAALCAYVPSVLEELTPLINAHDDDDCDQIARWLKSHQLFAEWTFRWIRWMTQITRGTVNSSQKQTILECAQDVNWFAIDDWFGLRFDSHTPEQRSWAHALDLDLGKPFSAAPEPWRETEQDFLERAREQYRAAVAHLSLTPRPTFRRIDVHAKWFVLYQVMGRTFAQIADADQVQDDTAVVKAVNTFAELIRLPLRSARGRTTLK